MFDDDGDDIGSNKGVCIMRENERARAVEGRTVCRLEVSVQFVGARRLPE